MTTRNRKLYYFHIQHDRSEMSADCPHTYVNADNEWQAIERTLQSLPTPEKMYNDSFLFKSGGPQDAEIVRPHELICAFIVQPYLSKNNQEKLLAQIRKASGRPQGSQAAYLRRIMGNFSTLPYFSNNDRILLKLASRGTNLVACESQALHQDSERCSLSLKKSFGSERHVQDASDLLRITLQRNEFIAGQIDLTLKPGETGVLFLGHLHGINGHMAGQIETLGIPVEQMNECRASEALENLFGLSGVALTPIVSDWTYDESDNLM